MPWSDRDVCKSKLPKLVIIWKVGQVVVILDHPDTYIGRAPGQCSEGCDFEKQNLSVCLSVNMSVCLFAINYVAIWLRKCLIRNYNFKFASLIQAFCESLNL